MRQEGKGKDYTVVIEDDGIGPGGGRGGMKRRSSRGAADKPDKPDGRDARPWAARRPSAASNYTGWSRAALELPDHKDGGIGWTLVRRIMPPGRRGYVFWAYLAAHPDGSVPKLPELTGGRRALEVHPGNPDRSRRLQVRHQQPGIRPLHLAEPPAVQPGSALLRRDPEETRQPAATAPTSHVRERLPPE